MIIKILNALAWMLVAVWFVALFMVSRYIAQHIAHWYFHAR